MTRLAHCGEDFARAIEDKQVEFLHPVEVVVKTRGVEPPRWTTIRDGTP